MWLAPESDEYRKMLREGGMRRKLHDNKVFPAVTNYTVLDRSSGCALVLLQPESGIIYSLFNLFRCMTLLYCFLCTMLVYMYIVRLDFVLINLKA